MAYLQDQDLRVFNLADEPMVAHTVVPEFSETLALHGLTNGARAV
jgi:hypothetical protein